MIKRIIRYGLIAVISLLITFQLIGTPKFSNYFGDLVKVGIIFSLFEIFLKPLVKILFLPINILTLGLFRFVISIPAFYLANHFVNSFLLNDIHLSASTWQGFVFPPLNATGIIATAIAAIIYSIFFYLLKSVLIKK